MKKLMITVAMLVACSASSFADTCDGIVYEVKCSLKTTKAKSAVLKKTSYTINFGMDAKTNGKFWYMDDAIVQNADHTQYGNVGSYEKVIVYDADFKASRGRFSNAFELLNPEDKLEVVKMLSYNEVTKQTAYKYKSANQWCATVTFTIDPGSICYKIAGSEKLVGYLIEINDCCCSAGSASTPSLFWTIDSTFADMRPANVIQYNRFNGPTADRASKAELLISIGEDMMFGGIGTYDAKNGFIKALSGYVLMLEAAPTCESCCSAPVSSIVHTVCGIETTSNTKVAYGVMTMKYSKKLTQTFNNSHN